MLASYQAVIKNGQVQFQKAVQFPEGTSVVVVVALESVEAQEQRLAALSLAEWQAPFVAFEQSAQQSPPAEDIDLISDEELVTLVHQVRAEHTS
jgi:hypothetical protein